MQTDGDHPRVKERDGPREKAETAGGTGSTDSGSDYEAMRSMQAPAVIDYAWSPCCLTVW